MTAFAVTVDALAASIASRTGAPAYAVAAVYSDELVTVTATAPAPLTETWAHWRDDLSIGRPVWREPWLVVPVGRARHPAGLVALQRRVWIATVRSELCGIADALETPGEVFEGPTSHVSVLADAAGQAGRRLRAGAFDSHAPVVLDFGEPRAP